MYINEETAQLILDAIAWSNKDWMETLNWDSNQEDEVNDARIGFIRFCKARGIQGVEMRISQVTHCIHGEEVDK